MQLCNVGDAFSVIFLELIQFEVVICQISIRDLIGSLARPLKEKLSLTSNYFRRFIFNTDEDALDQIETLNDEPFKQQRFSGRGERIVDGKVERRPD